MGFGFCVPMPNYRTCLPRTIQIYNYQSGADTSQRKTAPISPHYLKLHQSIHPGRLQIVSSVQPSSANSAARKGASAIAKNSSS